MGRGKWTYSLNNAVLRSSCRRPESHSGIAKAYDAMTVACYKNMFQVGVEFDVCSFCRKLYRVLGPPRSVVCACTHIMVQNAPVLTKMGDGPNDTITAKEINTWRLRRLRPGTDGMRFPGSYPLRERHKGRMA